MLQFVYDAIMLLLRYKSDTLSRNMMNVRYVFEKSNSYSYSYAMICENNEKANNLTYCKNIAKLSSIIDHHYIHLSKPLYSMVVHIPYYIFELIQFYETYETIHSESFTGYLTLHTSSNCFDILKEESDELKKYCKHSCIYREFVPDYHSSKSKQEAFYTNIIKSGLQPIRSAEKSFWGYSTIFVDMSKIKPKSSWLLSTKYIFNEYSYAPHRVSMQAYLNTKTLEKMVRMNYEEFLSMLMLYFYLKGEESVFKNSIN